MSPKIKTDPDSSEGQVSIFTRPPDYTKTRLIPLDHLTPDWLLLGAADRGLNDSVRDFGVRIAIILEELPEAVDDPVGNEEGAELRPVLYRIRDGRRRIRAARACGLDRIKAEVLPAGSSDDALTLITNAHRSENPASEYDAIHRLMSAKNLSAAEVGKALGIKLQRVTRLMGLGRLSTPLLDAFMAGDLKATAAFEAAKLPKRVQTGLARAFKKNGRLTLKDVRSARQVSVAKALEELPESVFSGPAASEGREVEWPITNAHGTFESEAAYVAFLTREGTNIASDAAGVTWAVEPIISGILIRSPAESGQ